MQVVNTRPSQISQELSDFRFFHIGHDLLRLELTCVKQSNVS
jgi:hypothetical protein